MAKSIRFIVTGYSMFPLDMLRYDACYPDRQEDVAELDASFDVRDRVERNRTGKPFTVRLVSYNSAPEAARWASFGWKVIDQRKSFSRTSTIYVEPAKK